MKPFVSFSGLVAPLDRENVDTDAIMPKQFLKSIKKTGFGPYTFDEWRYLDKGVPGMDCANRPLNPDFSLNAPKYKGAEILLTKDNFGCGSSREHAPWGLSEYGFKVILAPSFAEIFKNNCIKNGLLPICLSAQQINQLFQEVLAQVGYQLEVNLEQQIIQTPTGEEITFEIDNASKERLLKGLDDIGITLNQADKIRAYETKRALTEPWIFHKP